MNKIGYEIEHIDDEERQWFERQIEQGYVDRAIRLIDKKRLIEQLAAARRAMSDLSIKPMWDKSDSQ